MSIQQASVIASTLLGIFITGFAIGRFQKERWKPNPSNLSLTKVVFLALIGVFFLALPVLTYTVSAKELGYQEGFLGVYTKTYWRSSELAPAYNQVKHSEERYLQLEKENKLDEATIIVYQFGCSHCQNAWKFANENPELLPSDNVLWIPSTKTHLAPVANATQFPTVLKGGQVIEGFDEANWSAILNQN